MGKPEIVRPLLDFGVEYPDFAEHVVAIRRPAASAWFEPRGLVAAE
jgi:hypothetical protein